MSSLRGSWPLKGAAAVWTRFGETRPRTSRLCSPAVETGVLPPWRAALRRPVWTTGAGIPDSRRLRRQFSRWPRRNVWFLGGDCRAWRSRRRSWTPLDARAARPGLRMRRGCRCGASSPCEGRTSPSVPSGTTALTRRLSIATRTGTASIRPSMMIFCASYGGTRGFRWPRLLPCWRPDRRRRRCGRFSSGCRAARHEVEMNADPNRRQPAPRAGERPRPRRTRAAARACGLGQDPQSHHRGPTVCCSATARSWCSCRPWRWWLSSSATDGHPRRPTNRKDTGGTALAAPRSSHPVNPARPDLTLADFRRILAPVSITYDASEGRP